MVPGTLLRVTNRQGDWIKLQWATGSGWTKENAVRATGTTAVSN
jgi:hypothetical protein